MERRLPSCQDLALMAFWTQLSRRLGSVSRGMCHHPTAWAVTGDGWGENTEEPILTCSSFSECSCLFVQELCCLWLLLCFLSPLWLQTLHVRADCFATLLGNVALCRRSAPECFWATLFLRTQLRNVSGLEECCRRGCQSPCPPASPPLRDSWAN